MKPIRLAIADDQLLFLKGLKLLLKSFEEIELIIEAHNGQELLDAIAQQEPDVVITDLRMPILDGLEATEQIKALYPNIKILLLSMYDDERLINHMMKVGANGYLLKNEEPEVLRKAIHAVVEKEFYFTDYVSKALLKGMQRKNKEVRPWKAGDTLSITKREMEVLQLICKQYTSAEIAEELVISIRTVENHRKSLMEKTDVKNTAGLIIFAIRNQLVVIDELT
ncbi:MAG: response regulator transcription factor [Bacteroidota bacterium]